MYIRKHNNCFPVSNRYDYNVIYKAYNNDI